MGCLDTGSREPREPTYPSNVGTDFIGKTQQMKLVRDAKTLSLKAISSLRVAMEKFNSYDDDGRVTSVLLHLQHASEMLMKATLCQKRVNVFDKTTGKSIGFEKCLRLCQSDHGLTESEAGVFRAVDRLRDAAQHWFVYVSEDFLYLHTRALVTAFDSVLKRSLALDLHSHIPSRVLPVSTRPPGDFDFLVDREFKLIADLLRPGKRHRDEARGRIRSLLAMEALVTDEVEISEKDIDRIEKAMRAGNDSAQVFPRLNTVSSDLAGEGPAVTVHFSKKHGAAVRFVDGDDPEGAAAVRQVDLQKKYHMRASDLAKTLGLKEPKSLALRRHLSIDADAGCCHVFEFGKTKIPCFSDNARAKMRGAIDAGLDMDAVWKAHRPSAKKQKAAER